MLIRMSDTDRRLRLCWLEVASILHLTLTASYKKVLGTRQRRCAFRMVEGLLVLSFLPLREAFVRHFLIPISNGVTAINSVHQSSFCALISHLSLFSALVFSCCSTSQFSLRPSPPLHLSSPKFVEEAPLDFRHLCR